MQLSCKFSKVYPLVSWIKQVTSQKVFYGKTKSTSQRRRRKDDLNEIARTKCSQGLTPDCSGSRRNLQGSTFSTVLLVQLYPIPKAVKYLLPSYPFHSQHNQIHLSTLSCFPVLNTAMKFYSLVKNYFQFTTQWKHIIMESE